MHFNSLQPGALDVLFRKRKSKTLAALLPSRVSRYFQVASLVICGLPALYGQAVHSHKHVSNLSQAIAELLSIFIILSRKHILDRPVSELKIQSHHFAKSRLRSRALSKRRHEGHRNLG
jgi:hypothetical protein